VIEWASKFSNLSANEACLDFVNKTQEVVDANYSLRGNSKATANHSNQVTMIPFLSGECSSGFHKGATGAVMGITRDTTPAHIMFKACLESVAFWLRAPVTNTWLGYALLWVSHTTQGSMSIAV
jgi:glycerol kinase